MDFFLGQIQALGCNYAPLDLALCQGQTMMIQQNNALYSLLGAQFGGDGRNTFGLPDLRSKLLIGAGQGPGLTYYAQGEAVGEESLTLTLSTMPNHNHVVAGGGGGTLAVSDQLGTTDVPTATVNTLGVLNDGQSNNYYAYGSPGGATSFAALNTGLTPAVSQLGITGSGTPFSIIQPVQAFTYAICLSGYYPTYD